MLESFESYLRRKLEEIELLNSFVSQRLTFPRPKSIEEVVEQKFQLASTLKAEHVLHDWTQTETAWARSGTLHSGAFQFEYDYQRADLDVRGPSFYSPRNASGTTVYTASGMAAISALLMATAQVFGEADVLIGSNSYAETIELIDVHLKQLKQVVLDRRPRRGGVVSLRPRPRILLVTTPARLGSCSKPLLGARSCPSS